MKAHHLPAAVFELATAAPKLTPLSIEAGAHYDRGMTHITCTRHVKTPSGHQQRCFTAMLKAHICSTHALLAPLAAQLSRAAELFYIIVDPGMFD